MDIRIQTLGGLKVLRDGRELTRLPGQPTRAALLVYLAVERDVTRDVVLGTLTGVLFIPPHLAEEVVEHSERTHLREIFSHTRLREGIYNSSQMDTKWTEAIEADFDEWMKTHKIEGYESVDFEQPGQGAPGEGEETLLG